MNNLRASLRTSRLAGFTLIETVISLAILALVLGVVYESFGWSLRRTATLERWEIAWLTAQSLLGSIRGRDSLRVGSEQGETSDGLKWQTRIGLHDAQIDPQSPIKPFEVTIDVRWGDLAAQRATLQSVETSRVSL